jgi:hypothetical protein
MANPITPLRPVTGPARYRLLEKRARRFRSPELGPRLKAGAAGVAASLSPNGIRGSVHPDHRRGLQSTPQPPPAAPGVQAKRRSHIHLLLSITSARIRNRYQLAPDPERDHKLLPALAPHGEQASLC